MIAGMKTSFRTIRRERLDLTQKEAAEIAGVSQGQVSKWESTKASPSLAEIQRLLDWAGAHGKPLSPTDFQVSK